MLNPTQQPNTKSGRSLQLLNVGKSQSIALIRVVQFQIVGYVTTSEPSSPVVRTVTGVAILVEL